MNDLSTLMHAESSTVPPTPSDMATVLATGRRRVRRRRALGVGGAALAAGALAVGLSVTLPIPNAAETAAGPAAAPGSDLPGPQITLTGAVDAVAGQHYDVLASQTNDDLNSDNGTYLRGVTDDGLTLIQDGPRIDSDKVRWGLRSPAGDVEWLPARLGPDDDVRPLALGHDRLVLARVASARTAGTEITVELYDRTTRTWSSRAVPRSPIEVANMQIGPDERLWYTAAHSPARAPGDTDDADTFRLLSVALDGRAAPRVEASRMGSYGFGNGTVVWTDATNGRPGMVHVRDTTTGEERSHDPRTDDRCDLLGFSVAGERIALNQHCGVVDGARDDRIQVISTDGDQIGTFRGNSFEGRLVGSDGRRLLVEHASAENSGSYLVDLDAEDRPVFRLAQGLSGFPTYGLVAPDGAWFFSEAVNDAHGDKTTVVRWRD